MKYGDVLPLADTLQYLISGAHVGVLETARRQLAAYTVN